MKPETHYARSGEVNIAYQVVGEGPRDLVLVPGWVSNIEVFWEEPSMARFLQRLASFSRLILFDKRGTGLSDRVSDMPNLETRMDDVRAVMDAVRSTRAALLGYSEGGPLCMVFGATYPARTAAVVMIGSFARRSWAPTTPGGRRGRNTNSASRSTRGTGGGRWGSTSGRPPWPTTRASGSGGAAFSGRARAPAPIGGSWA